MARKREVQEGFNAQAATIAEVYKQLNEEIIMIRRYNFYLEQLWSELMGNLISKGAITKPEAYLMVSRAKARAYTPDQVAEGDKMAAKQNREYNERQREAARFR